MNTSILVHEFVDLQNLSAEGALSEEQSNRRDTLKKALSMAELRVRNPQERKSPFRIRIRDGEEIQEVDLPQISRPLVDIRLRSPAVAGDRRLAVVEPGPGLPAFVCWATILGPSDKGRGWYRLELE